MLKSLYISNYVLIDELDIQFEKGFTVITGETGAGKSVILGALALLFGQRAETKMLRSNDVKCVIEAVFDISDNKNLSTFFEQNELDYDAENCIVRREISVQKSRSFINDTPVGLNVLRDLSQNLIDIHSQHQNLLLMNHGFQLSVVDAIASNHDLMIRYKKLYNSFLRKKRELALLIQQNETEKSELDYFQFQHDQLTDARLSVEEFEEIEKEFELLSHAAEIISALEKSVELFEGEHKTLALLKENIQQISAVKRYIGEASTWTDRLETVYIEIKDIQSEVGAFLRKIDFQPQRLQQIQERLNEIYALQNKFRVKTVEELIQIREEFALKIKHTEQDTEKITVLEKEITETVDALKKLSAELTEKRKTATKPIEEYVSALMKQLGVPNIRFEVHVDALKDFSADGKDEIKFYFSANKNQALKTVQEVASGGEISRLMLCIKSLIAGKTELPTIIFDEIDMGVSGEIAHRMGEIMQAISKNMQVITITHLPQIASKGNQHIKVQKDETGHQARTYMKQLTAKERVNEIAQMLSGNTISEAALANAKVLLSGIQ